MEPAVAALYERRKDGDRRHGGGDCRYSNSRDFFVQSSFVVTRRDSGSCLRRSPGWRPGPKAAATD